MKFTESQIQRLKEFGDNIEEKEFASADERERVFSRLFSELTAKNDLLMKSMISEPKRHVLSKLESDLSDMLTKNGFTEVKTPLIISKASLEKMTITESSELYRQVFMIDGKRCLRPMLAPNLYYMMRKLRDRTKGPVRIFEIGSCFRKESKSNDHLEEFTMLNLVELGPEGDPAERLKELISKVMEITGLDHTISAEYSEVYKETLDVEVNGTEVASGAVGPHVLDAAHDIREPWCGAGFGLERLLMGMMRKGSVKKVGRSLAYLNGAKIELM
ncbi:MAG: pyrrolysine--tRNA(Pyl) ligase large subunit [Methanomassiliicoccaceae archaeon]|nr:pyrrolysine--tRNA(Pyl) ligase large subunit [Methanomassiliicoccaceae archaeon]